jgi:PIN like domain
MKARLMKDIFPWYFFGSAEKHYEKIWKDGILTVDANVLLGLYRYHSGTRDALLSAMESFKGRIWISHQTFVEFIRNRRSVIADISLDFDRAAKTLDDIKKSNSDTAGRLRGFRIIPKEPIAKFEESIATSVNDMLKEIENEKEKLPNFLESDAIVDRLAILLDKSIGSKPTDLDEAIKEASKRTSAKIPPGYADKEKDGDRHAGDYLMWREVLRHAKEAQKPIILVTSERKEDWWEMKSGRTLGPRLELLQEAFETSGYHVAIYHTDRFLEYHQRSKGEEADREAISEIREVAETREVAKRPAVSVFQELTDSDTGGSVGTLRVHLFRSVYNFTSSGRFDPQLVSVPGLDAKLVSAPEGAPNTLLRANTGTNYDFNIHIHSAERGVALPPGEYIIEYSATCPDIFS